MNEPSPEALQEVEAALQNGRKIEAIKLYREATGVGLAEAKEAVEAMAPEAPTADTGPGQAIKSSSGCLGLVLLVIAAAAVIVA